MSAATRDLPTFDFAARRERLFAHIGDGLAIFRAPPLTRHANDVEHRYRPNSDFFYLTGFPESDAVAVFNGASDKQRFLLFVAPKDPERETWTGTRVGVEGAVADFAADAAWPIEEVDKHLTPLIAAAPLLHYGLGEDEAFDQRLLRLAGAGWSGRPRSAAGQPNSILDPRPVVHEMRLRKSDAELSWMRRSIDIAARAHCAVQREIRGGMWEHEIQALIESAFRREGAAGWAYPSIVAGGANATVLHYVDNEARLSGDDLLLIDAGCELGLYCADITRTFPVGRDFSPEQRKAYEVVLEAQKAATGAVRPGATIDGIHAVAVEILTEGLLSMGVIQGTLAHAITEKLYRPWYMHRTSHWLGMDVHDVGTYEEQGAPRPLEAGMVLTIEPGLYFSPTRANTPEPYQGIGIRIEDDILVTADGAENLSAAVPKEIDEMLEMRE
jgi:Xaa-Pro aminopeptidase